MAQLNINILSPSTTSYALKQYLWITLYIYVNVRGGKSGTKNSNLNSSGSGFVLYIIVMV